MPEGSVSPRIPGRPPAQCTCHFGGHAMLATTASQPLGGAGTAVRTGCGVDDRRIVCVVVFLRATDAFFGTAGLGGVTSGRFGCVPRDDGTDATVLGGGPYAATGAAAAALPPVARAPMT